MTSAEGLVSLTGKDVSFEPTFVSFPLCENTGAWYRRPPTMEALKLVMFTCVALMLVL